MAPGREWSSLEMESSGSGSGEVQVDVATPLATTPDKASMGGTPGHRASPLPDPAEREGLFPIWVDMTEGPPERKKKAFLKLCKLLIVALFIALQFGAVGLLSRIHSDVHSMDGIIRPRGPPSPPPPASGSPPTQQSTHFGLPDAEGGALDGTESRPGLLPVHVGVEEGKVLLEVSARYWREGEGLLYLSAIDHALGTQSIFRGGWFGKHATRVVRFRRWGRTVRLVAENENRVASSGDPYEVEAVEESFADAALFSFPAVAARADGSLLLDAGPFLAADTYGVAAAMARSGDGAWSLAPSLGAPLPDRCRAFATNTVLGAELSFTSMAPGPGSRGSADPSVFTVSLQHTLMELPPPGYAPRRFDPRAGVYGTTVHDYSAPLGAEVEARVVHRHRLAPGRPLRYYLDRGAPEPVRSALLDGARWWSAAFEAAGWGADMFQVELMPEGGDLMDASRHVIQWVHRISRGYSIGHEIVDPRTGEIVKAHVTLGSLRSRQVFKIAEALLLPYAAADSDPADAAGALNLTLARLRQLAAHEVGHTLGLTHNFAGSAGGSRASVMDYPPPRIPVGADGRPQVGGDVYGEGVGAWDVSAIRYLYEEFPGGGAEEAAGLEAIVREAEGMGLLYLTDGDANAGTTPLACRWDLSRDGMDAASGLERAMAVRRAGLAAFGPAALPPGRALVQLEEAFVPVYLYHRYEVACTAGALGGLNYSAAVREAGQAADQVPRASWPVPRAVQEAALSALLAALHPSELVVPDQVVGWLPPRPYGYSGSSAPAGELISGNTGAAWDPQAAVATAARMVLSELLRPDRAARLAQQGLLDEGAGPSLERVLQKVLDAAFAPQPPAQGPREEAALRVVQQEAVSLLMSLGAKGPGIGVEAAATVDGVLRALVRYPDPSVEAAAGSAMFEAGKLYGNAAEVDATGDGHKRFYLAACSTDLCHLPTEGRGDAGAGGEGGGDVVASGHLVYLSARVKSYLASPEGERASHAEAAAAPTGYPPLGAPIGGSLSAEGWW